MNVRRYKYALHEDITGRKARRLVYYIQELKSDVRFEKKNRDVNAKSLIAVLLLDLKKDDLLIIKCIAKNDANAKEDCAKIVNYLNDMALGEF